MADLPTLDPSKVRAVITTKWTNSGYQPVVVRSIESYFIESNLDQDSDNFSLVIGDPKNALSAMRNRDSEIRVQLFGVGTDIPYLLTGLVDDVDVAEDGRVILTGRDYSAIATDTLAKANLWRSQKTEKFIEGRATDLKLTTRFKLTPGKVHKTIRTDGSETEWELWYRLVRKENQWLWFTSNGWLVSGPLDYNSKPVYHFGSPPLHSSTVDAKQWIPVEKVAYKKSSQSRIDTVYVFYKERGHIYSVHASDPTIKEWMRKPLKYIEDRHVSSKKQATVAAWEEIYESKVGALEIKITIPDVGIIVRQNTMARLHIPELDLGDDWFVVGSRIVADDSGYTQEIRLREKNYAITKRKPDEPEVAKEPGTPTAIEECQSLCDVIPRWCDFFVRSAHESRGTTDFPLFLATLLAICEKETNFRNIRNNGGPVYKGIEWFKWDGTPRKGITTLQEWKTAFANQPGAYAWKLAVGPMQLFDQPFKETADKFNQGTIDEFYGNRWLPEANIMVAGEVLNGKGGSREETLWAAVAGYGGSQDYADDIRRAVYQGGWLKKVQEAVKVCTDDGGALSGAGITIPMMHETTHCTANYTDYHAYDFMGNTGEAVYLEEGAKADPNYGQAPHLQGWKKGFGGWTFQLVGDSKTHYWFTHLDENDDNRYEGGRIIPGGYVGRLTSSSVKADLIGGAHVHVGSPEWPYPDCGSKPCRDCPH